MRSRHPPPSAGSHHEVAPPRTAPAVDEPARRGAASRLALAVALLLLATAPTRAEIGDFAADGLLGQSGWSDTAARDLGPSGFSNPKGVAIDRSTTPARVFVSDPEHHRVLGWADVDALAAGTPADIVIGQPDFYSIACNQGLPSMTLPGLDMLCEPTGLAVDPDGSLYVVDTNNCRVLVFDDPFGTDTTADRMLGESRVCIGVTTDAGHLFLPRGVTTDATGNVWVSDSGNCRVLGWDGPLTATDTAADHVLGANDFTTRQCTSLYWPEGLTVAPDGTVWVGTQTQVVGFFDPLTTDAQADRWIGSRQCNEEGQSASTTCGPIGVATDSAGRLYVADAGNSRVLLFSSPRTVAQAARVIGQTGFIGDSDLFEDGCNDPTGVASATTLCLRRVRRLTLGGTYTEAAALAVDEQDRLWVADGLNHRVLRYDTPRVDSTADLVLGQDSMSDVREQVLGIHPASVAVSNWNYIAVVVDEENSRLLLHPSVHLWSPFPTAAIGQPDLATKGCNTGGRSASTLCNPGAAYVDRNGHLWVADTGNNRVLRFDHPWLSYNYSARTWEVRREASVVFGQTDFSSATCGAGVSGLCAPRGVVTDRRDNTYIADTGNHRVVHHENPLADHDAERVYGQADFLATGGCNGGGTPSAATLCSPHGLVMDDDADLLWIADTGNNRVVAYDDPFRLDGGADQVIGQPTATSAGCSAGASGLCAPLGLGVDARNNLYVADTGNDRVLVFEAPLTDATADRVFGQGDFDTTGCPAEPSRETLCAPTGVAPANSAEVLVVADAGHERVVRFDAPFCIDEFKLTPASRLLAGLRSGPKSTKIEMTLGPGANDDLLAMRDKLVLLERDGGVDAGDEPLLELETDSGVVWSERVPSMSNLHSTNSGGVWATRWLKGERDQGIDDFRVAERFVIPPGFGDSPQYDNLSYKGRAVGLDLSAFVENRARWRVRYGSTCFETELACRGDSLARRCQPAR